MNTIASEVRLMFLRIMLDELREIEERAAVLEDAELFDSELKHDLKEAHAYLSKARARVDYLLGKHDVPA